MEPKGSFDDRVCNFNAGPSALPLSVLQKVQRDLLNWNNSGLSIMEYVFQYIDIAPVRASL
jgi:phosphoserine aminotransferase